MFSPLSDFPDPLARPSLSRAVSQPVAAVDGLLTDGHCQSVWLLRMRRHCCQLGTGSEELRAETSNRAMADGDEAAPWNAATSFWCKMFAAKPAITIASFDSFLPGTSCGTAIPQSPLRHHLLIQFIRFGAFSLCFDSICALADSKTSRMQLRLGNEKEKELDLDWETEMAAW